MQTNLTATMDGIAALITSSGLVKNVYEWPTNGATPPCAIVGWPTSMVFDMTFQRGGDEMVIPVYFVVGDTSNKDARDALSTILGDATSIKSALDGVHTFGDVRVTEVSISEFTIGAAPMLAAKFDCEVI